MDNWIIKVKYIGLSVCAGLFLQGCTPTQINGHLSDWFRMERLKPVPMRKQIFHNTPTAKIDPKKKLQYNEITAGAKREGYGQARGYYDSTEPQNEYNDDSYGAGFEAGCDTHVSIVGSGTMRLIKHKIDAHRLTTDQWYLRGFQDAASWCTFNLDWELH
jgi:hypothetical protein